MSARMVSPRWMAGAFAAGALGMLAAAPAFAAKDAVMAVYSTFTTLDPYDANDTLSQAASKSFYQGLFGMDKDMKLVNVLADSYDVSKDGLVYTIKLKKGIKFHDGTTFDAAVKVTLKEPFSPFINVLAHPSAVMISPAALQKYGKEIAFHPVGTGPFEFVEWKQPDHLKGKKFAGYWKTGYPKIDSITWKPVVDNNTRAAIMQTGEADFAFSIPFEQAAVLKNSPKVELISSPSIIQRYLSLNTTVKPFNDPKVRQAINYAINKDALAKVAFAGYAVPAEGVVPPGVDFAEKLGPWPYDPAKARALLKEAGYPNGFETTLWSAYNHTTAQKVIQFVQQQLQQVGIKAQVQALEAGQRVEKVESVQKPEDAGVRIYYVGWSSSTGESDWALRPLLASESMPPKLLNTAYYKNDQVDADIAGALRTTDRGEKARLYKDAQERIWKDAPWAFLVTEKVLFARSKRLTGAYVMPDGSFNFDEIDIKQ
ncbi:Glutathione-binding protein GsiB [compost metagenome]